MNQRTLYFVYPGDINTVTGGYRYDKRVIEGLALNSWAVKLVSLTGDFPNPDATQLDDAGRQLSQIPDGALVLIDGLAFGAMPQQLAMHAARLTYVALVHHPLALETGLNEADSSRLAIQEKQSLGFASLVITTSLDTARSLHDYGVSDSRSIAIPPGTNLSPQASGSGISNNGNDRAFMLLCVATLTQRKGHKVLLDALHQLQDLDWHLHCVGSKERDTSVWNALRDQQVHLGLEEKVSFVGEVSDGELDQYYQSADLFVLPSYHEGYGMVLSEALAYGLPVIASDAGAISSTVPEQARILTPPGDVTALATALRQFMQNGTARTALQSGARQARRVRRSWEDVIRAFDTALIELSTARGKV